jgi:excisionase family DNA binding protein
LNGQGVRLRVCPISLSPKKLAALGSETQAKTFRFAEEIHFASPCRSTVAFADIVRYADAERTGENDMTPLLSDLFGPVTPSAGDTQLAQESSRQLAKLLGGRKESVRVHVQSDGGEEETLAIPLSAARLLNEILAEMAKGNAVTLFPVHAELTTQQAADLLNVSHSYLIDLLENGAIPFRTVGTHRHMLFDDVMNYKRKIDGERLKALEELSALDQELGLGYEA